MKCIFVRYSKRDYPRFRSYYRRLLASDSKIKDYLSPVVSFLDYSRMVCFSFPPVELHGMPATDLCVDLNYLYVGFNDEFSIRLDRFHGSVFRVVLL